MRRLSLIVLFLISVSLGSQEMFTISGYVKDKKNGETVVGATVYKLGTNLGSATNEYGFYSLSLEKGNHVMAVSLLGYETYTFNLVLDGNVRRNVEIGEDTQELEEVVIIGEAQDNNVKSVEMGVSKLDIKQINKIPALLGEVDVIRAIQLLPGVTTMGEGASGFNVRGGNIDQNLILLDEAPVYNSSHLFGFFSVFNPDAVKDVKLIKGGIPAQYGGRVSSILDVRMKEGNSKKFAVSGGIGTIFSRLSVEGPLVKDKASFIVALRRSYIDALVKPFLKETSPIKNADFYYYDLTAKINYRLNDRHTVFLSGYLGRDVFGLQIFGFNWGNATATARWNFLVNRKLFMNLTAFYSNYDYLLDFTNTNGQGFNWKSNVINYSIKEDFSYYASARNTIRFGGQALLFDFLPYDAKGKFENTSEIAIKADKRFGAEYAGYVSSEHKFTPKLSGEVGLRVSMYTYYGPGTAFEYGDTLPNEPLPLENTTTYKKGEAISSYINPEPRMALTYLLDESSSLKASYNRMAQYLQLISNTAASTPLDVYTIASNNMKPLIGDQGSLGYFRNFGNNMFESSVEVYYKYLQNQLDYIDNAELFINEQVESQLLQGLGRAYGAELYVKKNRGRWQGWFSYTLSRTERLVRGISNDKWFNSRYDRTHIVNTSVNYDLTKRWNLSVNFVFLSGVPATFPNSKIQIQGINIPFNTNNVRNNFRITPYHRLDLGATYNFRKNENRRFKQSLVFSVYNAYSRRNAYSIFFRTKPGSVYETEAVRFSMIGTIVPAVSYNFNF